MVPQVVGAARPALFDSVQPETAITARPVLSPEARTNADERGDGVATTGEPLIEPAAPAPLPAGAVTELLRNRGLRLPLDDADIDAMKGGFDERRDAEAAGTRRWTSSRRETRRSVR